MKSLAIILAVLSFPAAAIAAEVSTAALERTADQMETALEEHRNLSDANHAFDAVFHRDPMKPLINTDGVVTASAGMSSGLSVQGIIWGGERPLAVIDDELVGRGETVGPYTIQEVLPDGVIVEREGKAQLIPLDREAGK